MKSKFSVKMKKMVAALIAVIMIPLVVFPIDVIAAEVEVSANREDTYNLLLDAAQINVIANTVIKCLNTIPSEGSDVAISGGDALGGKVFSGGLTEATNTTMSTALWVESWVQGNGGDDGGIWCKQASGKGTILKIFADRAGLDMKNDILCNGGYHRLIQRAYYDTSGDPTGYTGKYQLAADTNCSSLNDAGAAYLRAPDASAQFKAIYDNWYNQRKAVNRFVPSYNELGKFNNVDGYFNYIADFNTVCKADVVNSAGKIAGTDYYKITKYKKDTRKVVAENRYYHVSNNKTWDHSLSTDNPVKSCTGLLNRISELQTNGNGIPINGRSGGYENIILAELNDDCANIKTSDGKNGWTEIKNKLQNIINNSNSSAEDVQRARENLQKVNNAISSGNYVESSGDEDADGGKVYQCLDIDGLNIGVDDYETFIPEDQMSVGKNDPCRDNSGALGWLVCPVITWVGDTLNTVYDEMVEPFLKVDPNLISSEGATYQAWEIFRNIANIVFVILFLIVIFSQITGVGIDNYGIKRILPKLIVSAILINLSYIICQLAVDLSNIVGSGANVTLSNIASGIPSSMTGEFTSGLWFKHVLNSLLGVLGIGGAVGVVGTIMAAGILGGIILPLLLGLFTALISVICFFALLGMRQAGVVVLVAVAPLAFVCYMLPNTKKIFDKWLRIFEALLLLYPICGLVIGGSALASKVIIGSSDNFFVYLIGLMILVVPFFFIPTLLKNSFSALGNIGAKVMSAGSRFGRSTTARADKRIRSSDTFRRMDSALGQRSVFKRRRASSVTEAAALEKERLTRNKLSNRGNMQTRIQSIAAAEEAKATDEATQQRLSLMMSSGSQGGIVMSNGARTAFTLDNAVRRIEEIRGRAETEELSENEKLELSALVRGLSNMKGGSSKLGGIIRGASLGNGEVNANFMSVIGEIYTRDSFVQNKLNEKDNGAGAFTEHFMPGGDGLRDSRTGAAPSFTGDFDSYKGTAAYASALRARIKSYEAGLRQGGKALDEYIASLNKNDCQAIMDNEALLNSLDVSDRAAFISHASTLGVTGPSAKNVKVIP